MYRTYMSLNSIRVCRASALNYSCYMVLPFPLSSFSRTLQEQIRVIGRVIVLYDIFPDSDVA